MSTADVQRYILSPMCVQGRRAIVDTLRGQQVTENVWNTEIPAVAPATTFVSHCWQAPFDELLSALDEHMCSTPLDRKLSQYFWLDVFCVNPYAAATVSGEDWSKTFEKMIHSIGHTLLVAVPALAPLAVTRSWCIYETFCALQAPGCQFSVVTSHGEAATLEDVSSYEIAISTLAAIDSERAVATYEADKRRIDNAIVAAGGHARLDDAVRGGLLAELLQRAASRGAEHFGVVRQLCDAGASLESEVGLYRATALMTASNPRCGLVERRRLRDAGRLEEIREQDAQVVRYLLERGAHVNAQSSRTGDTALSCACRYGDRPAVLLLLAAGADPNLAQHGYNAGETPFLAAARWGAPSVLRDLAAAGARVNEFVYSSYLERWGTAAMWRGMYKSVANLRILAECRADLACANDDGVSVASLAAEAGCHESLAYLLDEVGVPDPTGLKEAVRRGVPT